MRLGEKIYYCSRLADSDTNGQEYSAPTEITLALRHFTIMERSGNSFIESFGFKREKTLRGVAMPYEKWNGVIKENDLFYLEGASPSEDEEFYGQNANYRVSNVNYGNLIIQYSFEKI